MTRTTVQLYGCEAADWQTSATIVIGPPMPKTAATRKRAFFASQGAALAAALWTYLPMGTVDAMIAALDAFRKNADG